MLLQLILRRAVGTNHREQRGSVTTQEVGMVGEQALDVELGAYAPRRGDVRGETVLAQCARGCGRGRSRAETQ